MLDTSVHNVEDFPITYSGHILKDSESINVIMVEDSTRGNFYETAARIWYTKDDIELTIENLDKTFNVTANSGFTIAYLKLVISTSMKPASQSSSNIILTIRNYFLDQDNKTLKDYKLQNGDHIVAMAFMNPPQKYNIAYRGGGKFAVYIDKGEPANLQDLRTAISKRTGFPNEAMTIEQQFYSHIYYGTLQKEIMAEASEIKNRSGLGTDLYLEDIKGFVLTTDILLDAKPRNPAQATLTLNHMQTSSSENAHTVLGPVGIGAILLGGGALFYASTKKQRAAVAFLRDTIGKKGPLKEKEVKAAIIASNGKIRAAKLQGATRPELILSMSSRDTWGF